MQKRSDTDAGELEPEAPPTPVIPMYSADDCRDENNRLKQNMDFPTYITDHEKRIADPVCLIHENKRHYVATSSENYRCFLYSCVETTRGTYNLTMDILQKILGISHGFQNPTEFRGVRVHSLTPTDGNHEVANALRCPVGILNCDTHDGVVYHMKKLCITFPDNYFIYLIFTFKDGRPIKDNSERWRTSDQSSQDPRRQEWERSGQKERERKFIEAHGIGGIQLLSTLLKNPWVILLLFEEPMKRDHVGHFEALVPSPPESIDAKFYPRNYFGFPDT